MPDPTDRYGVLLRLGVSLAAGVIVAGTAFLVAWNTYRNYYAFRLVQRETRRHLDFIRDDVEEFRKETGALPKQLADVDAVQKHPMRYDATGQPLDAWSRPIQYRVTAEGYALYSFGQDGADGGEGLDADIRPGPEDVARERLTLVQFLTLPATSGIRLSCALGGIIAIPICLLQGRRLPLGKALIANAVTVIACLVTALFMSILHLPSGH